MAKKYSGADPKHTRGVKPIEHRADSDPDQVAQGLLLANEADFEARIMTFEKAAEESGLSKQIIKNLSTRLRIRYRPLSDEMKQISTRWLQGQVDDRIHRILNFLDDGVLSQASAKDLTIMLGIMIEKRALLRGEPTQRISVEERHSITELMPAMLKEAQRRGITVDLHPSEYGGGANASVTRDGARAINAGPLEKIQDRLSSEVDRAFADRDAE